MMLDMVGTGRRVLEVGCSSGYISRFLAERNCKVTGIEFDPMAAAQARSFCEEVIVADLDLRPLVDLLPGTPFDVALFGDVLEHLRDPWRVLDETRSFLGLGSFAVLSVPNVAHGAVRLSLLQGSFNYMDQGLLDATHLRFFTLRSVRELCLRAGYRIEEVRRTKMDIFAKSDLLPEVDEADFDPALIADIRRDPDHDTLQFVVKVTPLGEREKFIVAVSDLVKTEVKLERALEAANENEEERARLLSKVRELERAIEISAADRASSEAADRERQASVEESFRLELGALQASLDTANSSRETLEGLAASFRDELEAVRISCRDLEVSLSLALSERERLQLEIAHAESALAELRQQHEGDVNRLSADFEAEREGLAKQIDEHKRALEESRVRYAERALLLETLTAQLVQTERRIDIVDAQWRASQAAHDELARSIIERNERETKLVRDELAFTDELIQETYRSSWWSLKRALGRLRFRGPRSRV